MVKLFEEDKRSANGYSNLTGEVKPINEPISCTTEISMNNSKMSSPESKGIDMKLVSQARDLLRQEYEAIKRKQQQENGKTTKEDCSSFSEIHYKHLMDEQHPETCWRYLLHTQLDLNQALELMKKCLIWRQETQVDLIRPKDLLKELYLKAPIGFTGKTRTGQDVIYATAKNYRKPDSAGLVRPVVKEFILTLLFEWERAHQNDFEKFTLVFDTTNSTLWNIDLDFSAWLVSLRDYVPSRIEAIYIVGIPFLIRPAVRLIISWLPERYRKIVYCCPWESLFQEDGPRGQQLLDLDQVPVEAGGTAEDSWRIVPAELQVPWAHETDRAKYSEELLSKVDSAINFNTSPERLELLVQMQRAYDDQQNGCKGRRGN